MEVITKWFKQHCIARPRRVERALTEIETVEQATDLLDKASARRRRLMAAMSEISIDEDNEEE